MQAFRATYKPDKFDEDTGLNIGYNDEKTETVLVLAIFPSVPDPGSPAFGAPGFQDVVAIIRGDNSLDVVPVGCITECDAPPSNELLLE